MDNSLNIAGDFVKAGCLLLLSLLVISCGRDQDSADSGGLVGSIKVDGSSTVFPVSEAVAEEFLTASPGVRVTVGVSGTGGGFEKFFAREIDINNSSRRIKTSEIAQAEANDFKYVEIPVALDGLSIVVNPNNDWIDSLTVDDLRRIWQPGSTVNSWSDIREGWPDIPLRLYGPGTDSGTFEYFTEAIVGEMGSARPDYTASEDDNVLVQGISGDVNALGFFGYAYYQASQDKLKLIPVNNGSGPVLPEFSTISDGSYNPLTRKIFIYVSLESLQRQEVKDFVNFYLNNAAYLSDEVGYVPLDESEYQELLEMLATILEN